MVTENDKNVEVVSLPIDRDKGNNVPDNLELMTASAHTSEHMDEILEKRGHVRRA
jgi:hypothetical protein